MFKAYAVDWIGKLLFTVIVNTEQYFITIYNMNRSTPVYDSVSWWTEQTDMCQIFNNN